MLEFYINNMLEKKKIKITLNEYHTTCGDGCCDNYGTITTIDGIEMEFHNQDVQTQSLLKY